MRLRAVRGQPVELSAEWSLVNSYPGLILPLIASATATFLFRQFFLTIPEELGEAARGRRRAADAVLLDDPAAAVAHEHRCDGDHPVPWSGTSTSGRC